MIIASAIALLWVGLVVIAIGWSGVQPGSLLSHLSALFLRPTWGRLSRQHLWAGFVAGVAGLSWVWTGWLPLLVLVPMVLIGLPAVVRTASEPGIEELVALQQWLRRLTGALSVGHGLESALLSGDDDTHGYLAQPVKELRARLRAGVATDVALRGFSQQLHEPVGELAVAALIAASRHRGPGITDVLTDLADSVSTELQMKRKLQSDRARPRTTARWVVLISVGVLAMLGIATDYLSPYLNGYQGYLVFLLLAFTAAARWMFVIAQPAARPDLRVG